jgi:hypothetical protein
MPEKYNILYSPAAIQAVAAKEDNSRGESRRGTLKD